MIRNGIKWIAASGCGSSIPSPTRRSTSPWWGTPKLLAPWTAIERLFHANKELRPIFLAHEFHTIKQDDSSIV
jgi:hypothetical protein